MDFVDDGFISSSSRHTSLLTSEYLFSAKGEIKYKNREISEFEGSYTAVPWTFK